MRRALKCRAKSLGLIVLLLALSTACDAMHRTRIIVPPPAAGVVNAAGSERVLSEARAVLVDQAFTKETAAHRALVEYWSWRDPAKLPGVRVSLVTSRDGVVVAIAQDLMGPIGRTEKYDALVTAVVTRLTACVGSENVRVE